MKLLALLAAFGLVAFSSVDNLQFQPESTLTVKGTSTVHDWQCASPQIAGTLQAEAASDGALTGLKTVSVTIPVQGLDCNNGTMNKKLRDALKASSSPAIRFSLSGAEIGTGTGSTFPVNATGRLTIAGQTQTVRIAAQGEVLGNGRYRFHGEVPLQMSAFGVDAPTAMLGTLKTGDAVTVAFNVVAR